MKFNLIWRRTCHRTPGKVLVASLFLLHFHVSAQPKTIYLRNETITTLPATNLARLPQAVPARAPAAGLFLVQFEGHVQPAWQAELRSNNVELLKYVPEDAFIARFSQVSVGKIRALSYVRWIGPYRPEHKIHPRLAAAAAQAAQTNALVAVNVLIAPGATPAEIAAARALLASVIHESHLRQGTILRGLLSPNGLDALVQSPAVLWVERAPRRRLVDEAAAKIVGGDDGAVATPTLTQQMGYDGSGVTVCVADTGLDTGDTNTMHLDLRGRVTGFRYYGNTNVISDGSDGYGHGTHAAGIVAGNAATGEIDPDSGAWYGLGVASHARLFIERIFDDNAGEADPFPTDETLTHDAVRNGAQIGSNSWGNDVQGDYDTDASQFDELVRDADVGTPGDQPYILVFSAGNAGPDTQTLDSPASAKNVLAVGASENVPGTLSLTYGLYADGPDTMADFSSRGPCGDGRLKPDVVAPGTWIASLASAVADETSVAWSVIDDLYVYMGGTSMSGPHAAGAAAIFVQYYKSQHANALPSPALVKAALINSAEPLDVLNGGPGPIPNQDEGWGRITLPNIIVTNVNTAPRYYEYVNQTVLLSEGQVYSRHTLVRNSDQPLKITLAYTDPPGFPGAIPALVNDLDLEVVAPDGTLYRGNQFAGSDSVPNAPSPDTLNNVEAVHLTQPLPGDYLVRVRARRVVQDARIVDTPGVIDQDFALVISGDLARPGAGSILMDRASYTAPGTIHLSVFDTARAGSNSVNVLVKSTTEPAGETYALHSSGSYGAFTGAVATAVGAAANDGKLELHSNDTIEADYVDSSGSLRSATAVADLTVPVLSGLAVTVDLGVITITWQSTEAADSVVRYSTNTSFNLAATNVALTTSHSVKLPKLIPGKTYSFYITSSDAAGNTVTNNNSGSWFTFVAVAPPTVLLVDAYEPVDGSPVIPDGTYTNAIAAAGFSFAHWKVSARGSPQLSDLQAYPVVMWRVIDDAINYGVDEFGFTDPSATNNTLSAQQQLMIQDYLDGGGSFFMSSMGILSQLGNVSFRRNVLQVGGFKQNPDPLGSCTDCDEDFGVPAVLGARANPITSGMAMSLDYSLYPSVDFDEFSFGPDFSDTFIPTTLAAPIFFEAASGRTCGISYPPVGVDSPGRVVFLSFPVDTIPASGTPPNNETVLLRNALNFLAPGANGAGAIQLDKNVYSVPEQVSVEVGDSDLAGTGQAQATFSTSSSANRVTLTLSETTHPGLFRGFLTLVATGASTNQLMVRNGDVLTAKYFDVSNNSNVVATATIDTVPPVITNVAAVTGYGDAVVSWTTSKPADSLVQYGDQALLLNQTAYAAALVTNHSVTLSGLFANRNYFYEVASRDAADNISIDDNHGTNYTFTTRQAPRPPWFDDLESGAPGWSVVPDPQGTQLNWTLGTPNNGLQTQAYSTNNAWGSDLSGQLVDNASSFLFSPFIDLSGFSKATLTFWHCYDFTLQTTFEQGQVLISTNSSAALNTLPVLQDFSGQSATHWEQTPDLELTPYVGQTIRVVWQYAGASALGSPMYGWLVDDIRITGVAGGGTIVVSKSLGQGNFTLTGPVSQTGKAPLTTITNAPEGPYAVQFTDVTFYQTPASQSATLTNGGTLTFTGNYTFIDVNSNNISDAWERYFFGSASTNRTQHTDTDGDGMTDYAEFIAGTDPTNAASKLFFFAPRLLTNHLVQLQWSAVPGRLYQVETSDLLPGAISRPSLSGSFQPPGGFKLHITAQSNLAYAIETSSNLTTWGSVYTNTAGGNMDYIDSANAARRFYRTLSLPPSTNSGSWTAITDWLQATGSPMSYIATNTGVGSHFYRVQVRP